MSIKFIANDPQSSHPDARIIAPHPGRPDNVAGITFTAGFPEAEYPVGTDEFLYWQCREAVFRTLDAIEALNGPLTRWFGNQSKIKLNHKASGNTPNAFYNRFSLLFYAFSTNTRSYYSGASTDVVAHETGHGFLDAIKPEIKDNSIAECDAFHEAFGDCVSILTSLADRQIREQLLGATADLRAANFVETTTEDLSDGIRQGIEEGLLSNSRRNGASPRRALNTFQWTPFLNLPANGDAGELIGQIHSFGQIFSGCFWDLLLNIFAALPGDDEAALGAAAQTAGRLLIAGALEAPLTSRYFREVGQAMVAADRRDNAGTNVAAIEQAFAGHGIHVDADAMLTPMVELSGRAPVLAATIPSTILTRASRRDIVRTLGETSGQRFFVKPAHIGTTPVAMARHRYYVALDDVDASLAGVEAPVEEDVVVGESDGHAAILGIAPAVSETSVEVLRYVERLIAADCVQLGESSAHATTHRIKRSGKRKLLRRYRYACFHC